MSWPLVDPRDDGLRASTPGVCFYCDQAIGTPHSVECVVVKRRVRLRYIIEVDVDVPHSWTAADIEQHRNDSSWCADNAIDDIDRHTSHLAEGEEAEFTECLCSRFRAEFVAVLDDTPIRDLTPEPPK